MISDDRSSPAGAAVLRDAVGDDPRFIVTTAPRRLGFYRNFERALALAPADAAFVAMADQDDAWYPDKLATLLGAIGEAQLVFSDARVVARDGAVVSETWWSTRRPDYTDLLSLLVANSVTGAASLFPRELLDDALPVPAGPVRALPRPLDRAAWRSPGATSPTSPRPLYDYVQHGAASLGHAGANQMTSLRERLRHQRDLRERVRMWRLHYFVDVSRLTQFAAVLQLRCGPRMSRASAAGAGPLHPRPITALGAACWGSPLRGLRELLAGTPETLGAEWMLAHALAWRRLLALSARAAPRPGGCGWTPSRPRRWSWSPGARGCTRRPG